MTRENNTELCCSSFEVNMSKVADVVGITADDTESFNEMAKALAEATKFSMTQATEAISYMLCSKMTI